MIFGRNRVEEDLEKIRRANFPCSTEDKTKTESDYLKLEKWDISAMILAVMSLVLPYILAFIGIMAGVMFLLKLFY